VLVYSIRHLALLSPHLSIKTPALPPSPSYRHSGSTLRCLRHFNAVSGSAAPPSYSAFDSPVTLLTLHCTPLRRHHLFIDSFAAVKSTFHTVFPNIFTDFCDLPPPPSHLRTVLRCARCVATRRKPVTRVCATRGCDYVSDIFFTPAPRLPAPRTPARTPRHYRLPRRTGHYGIPFTWPAPHFYIALFYFM